MKFFSKSLSLAFSALFSLQLFAAFEAETLEIQNKMNQLKVYKSYKYCVEGTFTCRDLVLLQDKVTNTPSDEMMYDNFISSERAVASTGYFLKNTDGTYRARLDRVFDGQIQIDLIENANSNLTVTFDSEGLPTFHNVILKVLGTTQRSLSTMTYSADQATILGFKYDEADPSVHIPYSVVYKRVK